MSPVMSTVAAPASNRTSATSTSPVSVASFGCSGFRDRADAAEAVQVEFLDRQHAELESVSPAVDVPGGSPKIEPSMSIR
jgi:hypothetical protein